MTTSHMWLVAIVLDTAVVNTYVRSALLQVSMYLILNDFAEEIASKEDDVSGKNRFKFKCVRLLFLRNRSKCLKYVITVPTSKS